MPNGVNLILLSNTLNTTPDYLLGFSDSASRNIDVKIVHEMTGLSDKSIENLNLKQHIHDDNKISFTPISETLNMLLERADFMQLLNSIRLNLIEAENKEYQLIEQKKLGKYGSWYNISELENLIKAKSLTLDPIQYFMYSNNQIKEKFISIVKNIIDTHISSIDVEKAVIDRQNKWDYLHAEDHKDSELLDK